MAADGVAADDDEFGAAVVDEGKGSAESLVRFGDGVRRADVAPEVFAGGRVDREEEGLVAGGLAVAAYGDVALQHLHDETAVVQERAGGEGPLKGEGPDVAFPEFFPSDIEGDEIAGAEEEYGELAVGHGGRGTRITVLAVGGELADLCAPEECAGAAVEAESGLLFRLRISGGGKHAVAPDDGCGGGSAGHFDGPLDAFGFAECGGEIFFGAGAVVERPAPIGPIFGAQGGGGEDEGEGKEEADHGEGWFFGKSVGITDPVR